MEEDYQRYQKNSNPDWKKDEFSWDSSSCNVETLTMERFWLNLLCDRSIEKCS